VHEAVGLPRTDVWYDHGSLPDAYVRIMLVDNQGRSMSCDSDAWQRSDNPVWGFCCDLLISSPVESGLLRIEVYEKNAFWTDELIGECKLNPLPHFMEWCALQNRHESNKEQGFIRLTTAVHGSDYGLAWRMPPSTPWPQPLQSNGIDLTIGGLSSVLLCLCLVTSFIILLPLLLRKLEQDKRRFLLQLQEDTTVEAAAVTVASHNYDDAKMIGLIKQPPPAT